MKDKNGFTLIELLAVIIILGILMIIAIPSVTNYIQNSRKEAYVKTSQNMVKMMTNEINTGKYPVYDTDITYYFPASCLKTETGGESPYGDWKERYVAVTYDGTSFDYYWTSLDEAGMGIYLSYSELLNVDLIYSDVKDLQLFIGVGNRTKILKFGDSCDPKDYSEVPLDSSISDKSLFIPDDINYDDVLYTSQFDSNNNINNKMKSIAGGSLSNITSIKYNATIPEGVEKQNIGKTSGDLEPIYIWFDNGTVYWSSQDKTPALSGNRSNMFSSYSNLENIDGLYSWDTRGLTGMQEMFKSTKITSLKALRNWNVSSVTSLRGTFQNIKITSTEGLEKWNTGNVTDFQALFNGSNSLQTIDALANWNTSKVTNFSGMFQNCTALSSVKPLANWNTGNVTQTIQTFQSCSSLTSLDGLNNWNMSKNTDMRQMFYQSRNIESLSPLKNWSTTSLKNLNLTFSQLKKITSLDGLQNFDTSKVTNFSKIFDGNDLINDVSAVGSWNVSAGTSYELMFYNLKKLVSGADALNNWKLNKSGNFNQMFGNTPNKPTFSFDVNGVSTPGTWSSNGTLQTP